MADDLATVPHTSGAAERDLSYCLERSRLVGSVHVSGAKNSVLRLMAASLLTPARIALHNYPSDLRDAQIHLGMLEALGKTCVHSGDALVISEGASLRSQLAWPGRSIRNTLLILGALTARLGAGAVPLPGGCDIGASGDRRYDLHVLVLETLGARVWSEGRTLLAEAPNGLVGADIHLPLRSTGATENALLCGTLARGVTRIWNPHIRPEIIDLIGFLRALGAKIEVFGQEHIEITGVEGLGGGEHRIMPDNVEALTWLVGAMVTGGEVEIVDFPQAHLEVPLIFLRESGARMFRGDDALVVRGGRCYPVDLATGPYPGINSDMQPLFAVYGAAARGESRLIDLRFPGRYAYADELARLGLQHRTEGNLLRIIGGAPLIGAEVRALDLRAGIALCLAGLTADGETVVRDAWQVERGYSNFVPKLKGLGGRIDVR
ncbi:MAG TPA: UDP-N-acetylglucosamine 1-carboxyvinyltransferase [Vitreimonas sp.]|nr:UDP-N-acetylglucosamine 1-carboxyvinyltransferase [Vitreimonas sp.]